MLYRHVQPLFVSPSYRPDSVVGPKMRVRPLDTDAPDHLLSFVFWGAIQIRALPPKQPTPEAPKPGKRTADPRKGLEVVEIPTPSQPKLLIEVSADGESWVVQSTLEPRERPYLVTVRYMLQYVRVRLETSGVEARGYALVIANGPFALDGRSAIVEPGKRPGGGQK